MSSKGLLNEALIAVDCRFEHPGNDNLHRMSHCATRGQKHSTEIVGEHNFLFFGRHPKCQMMKINDEDSN